jgi:integrase
MLNLNRCRGRWRHSRPAIWGSSSMPWIEAAPRARIKFKLPPHSPRHSFVTRFLAKNQGDIATVATILGRANISTARHLHPDAQ